MSGNSFMDEDKMKRTRVACETCRRKKIKCSGDQPCTNCIQQKDEINCKFLEKPKKLRMVEKPKGSSLKTMEDRLSRLEGYLVQITEKLVTLNDSPRQATPEAQEPAKPKLEDEVFDHEGNHYLVRERFFESHSFMSVCSTKSIAWISSSLRNSSKKEVIHQFERLPFFFFTKLEPLFKKFVDPVDIDQSNREKYLVRPLPDDYEYLLELLTSIEDDNEFFTMICPFSQLKQLLYQYFFGRTKLNNSNLLILCAIFVICLNARLTSKTQMGDLTKEKYSKLELNIFFEDLLSSSILLYQRICVISQGIETIRAILLLVTAFEASGSMILDLNYMILSVAIRYAHEYGLHRPESYVNLTEEEAESRRLLWNLCLRCDVEFCFRNGKPPISSSYDILRSSKDDLKSVLRSLNLDHSALQYFDPKTQLGYLSPNHTQKLYDAKEYSTIAQYENYLLSKLRFDSYFTLFNNVGNLHTIENLENILEDLNVASSRLSYTLVEEFKPRYFDEPQFEFYISKIINEGKASNSGVYADILNFHFLFYFQLMITNRVPFLTNITEDSPKIQDFRKIFIRSTRTLLHLGLRIDHKAIKSFAVIWLAFYPFAAFLILCALIINNPKSMEVNEDLKLLTDVSNYFFDIAFGDYTKDSVIYNLGNNSFGCQTVIMKVFLQLVVGVVDLKNDIQYREDEVHLKQIKILEHIAPELFQGKRRLHFKIHSTYNEEENLGSSKNSLSNITGTYSDTSTDYSYGGFEKPVTGQTPTGMTPMNQNMVNDNPVFDILFDDQMNDFVSSQMNSLPNFFFDNNLGFDS